MNPIQIPKNMEPILHIILPLFIILVFLPKLDKKLVIPLSILTILPDFDIFIYGMHRILFHNIFFVIIVSAIVYSTIGKQAFYLALYFISSHLLLDIAKEGAAFFWPFYDKFIYLQSEILRGQYFPADFKLSINTIPMHTVQEYMTSEAAKSYYLMTEGTQIIILILVAIALKYLVLNKFSKSQ